MLQSYRYENEVQKMITASKISNFNKKIWSEFSRNDTELVGPSFKRQSVTSVFFFNFFINVCQ